MTTPPARRTEGAPEEDDSLAKAYFGEAIFSAIYDHITPANLCEWQRESPDMAIGLPQRVAFDAFVDEVWNSIPPPSPAATVPDDDAQQLRNDILSQVHAYTSSAQQVSGAVRRGDSPRVIEQLRQKQSRELVALVNILDTRIVDRADLAARAEPAEGGVVDADQTIDHILGLVSEHGASCEQFRARDAETIYARIELALNIALRPRAGTGDEGRE